MVKDGKVPADVMSKLPPAESYAHAVFPTIEQQNASKTTITTGWDKTVGANVK